MRCASDRSRKPAAPLTLPATGVEGTATGGKTYENTSEEAADPTSLPNVAPGDPLSDALSGALPEGFVVPPLDGEN